MHSNSHIKLRVIATDRSEGQTFVGFASAFDLCSLFDERNMFANGKDKRPDGTHWGVIVIGLVGEPGDGWFTERDGEQTILHLRRGSNWAHLLAPATLCQPNTDEPVPLVAYSEPWPDETSVSHPDASDQPFSVIPSDLEDHTPYLFLARRLADDTASPWFGHIRMDASATPGLRRRVSLGMLSTAVRRFLETAGTAAPVTQDRRFALLATYWRTIARTFPHEWKNPRKHVLTKGIGLYSLTRLLVDLVFEIPFHHVTEKVILGWLSPLAGNVDWSNRGSLGTARSIDEAHAHLRKIIESRRDGISVTENGDPDHRRLLTQERCDAERTAGERNIRGQFCTPSDLARDIVRYSLSLHGDRGAICFLDPAFGTGAFYAALLELSPKSISSAVGFEVDPVYGLPARELWRDTKIKLRIEDFTRAAIPRKGRFNLVVCNPPYVRQHHLSTEEKARLRSIAERASGMRIGGQAGLYPYFLGITHSWMERGGLGAWLLPTQFMDAAFGDSIRRYLLDRVTLLRIHRFAHADGQFADAVVTSVVVWFRNEPPSGIEIVEFTTGGSIEAPKKKRLIPASELRTSVKWSRWPEIGRIKSDETTIGSYFTVKRGIVTGFDKFFVLPRPEIEQRGLPLRFFRPILPSPRYLYQDEVPVGPEGNPDLEPQLFVLDCHLPEPEVRQKYHGLWRYLASGRDEALTRYRCNHRRLWYEQEARPPAPFLCTYMGRNTNDKGPFRFILNHSNAIATNAYNILYPGPSLLRDLQADPDLKVKVWQALMSIRDDDLVKHGRTYGGGLVKLEPRELAMVPFSLVINLVRSK